MSQHPSLKKKASVGGNRSVHKRFERFKVLNEKEEWTEDMNVLGMPKLKIVKFKAGKKKEKKEEEDDDVKKK
jgi:small basic protein (TIGR04137 family)